MAALEKLKEERPEVVESCNVAAGLSLGEYTALSFAGAMTFEDGLKLVRLRRPQLCSPAMHKTPYSFCFLVYVIQHVSMLVSYE